MKNKLNYSRNSILWATSHHGVSAKFTLGILALCLAGPIQAAIVDDAKKLLESDDAAAAFELLEAEVESNRDPEFDYLYGIAALDSGRAGLALFAFERVLAADPNHLYARAELARALYRLGETADAQREFARVKSLNPPADVTARIAQYEAAMRGTAAPAHRLSAYIEGFTGYDSNYASATEDSAVGIPAFGNLLFTLDDLFVEDGSALVGGRSGGRYRAPLGTRSLIFANVDAEGTHYPGANAGFYHAAIGVGAGVAHRLNERHVVSANFNGYGSWVPELDYLRSLGVTANWDYQISERGQITSFFNFADLSFDEVIEYRDVRQYLFGSGYTHTFNDRLRIGGHVFGGMEDEQDDRRPDVGRDLAGVRALMTYGFSKKLTAYSSFAAQFSEYNGPDGLFLRTRDDDQFRVTGGLEYRFAPLWTLRPEINYVRNDSNIPTSKFERVVATISVRRNFE